MKDREESLLRYALADLTILLVGGDHRPHIVTNLRNGLGLARVIHRATRRDDASDWRFASSLRETNLVLVVCARGLTRTQHGKALHHACRRLGLPLVDCYRLPNPNRLIAAVREARLAESVVCRSQLLKPAAWANGGAA